MSPKSLNLRSVLALGATTVFGAGITGVFRVLPNAAVTAPAHVAAHGPQHGPQDGFDDVIHDGPDDGLHNVAENAIFTICDGGCEAAVFDSKLRRK